MIGDYALLDIITLTLILLLAIKGMINGLVKEFFRLLGIVGGVFFASRYADMVGQLVNDNIYEVTNKSSLYIIGFLAVFVSFWLVSLFFGFLFSKFVKFGGLGFIDSMGGFVVNGATIFLVFSIIFVAVSNIGFIQDSLKKYTDKSFMYPIYVDAGGYLINLKPEDLNNIKQKVEKKIKAIDMKIVDKNTTATDNAEQNTTQN